MVKIVTYLSTEKFAAAGVFARKNLEYIINDFVFVKKCSIENCSFEKVLNICKKNSKLNLRTIVVTGSEYLTVWVEDREKTFLRRVETIDNQKTVVQKNYLAERRKTIHKYRGREYVKENATINQNLVCTEKVIKKYRGRIY